MYFVDIIQNQNSTVKIRECVVYPHICKKYRLHSEGAATLQLVRLCSLLCRELSHQKCLVYNICANILIC